MEAEPSDSFLGLASEKEGCWQGRVALQRRAEPPEKPRADPTLFWSQGPRAAFSFLALHISTNVPRPLGGPHLNPYTVSQGEFLFPAPPPPPHSPMRPRISSAVPRVTRRHSSKSVMVTERGKPKRSLHIYRPRVPTLLEATVMSFPVILKVFFTLKEEKKPQRGKKIKSIDQLLN